MRRAQDGLVRWGILGTAAIVQSGFLPGLRATGTGFASAIGGRDPARTAEFARHYEIPRVLANYQAVIEDRNVDAVYIPLPNSMHASWTAVALEAGKVVLTEKPLCGSEVEAREIVATARRTHSLLWEAFVFPFQRQFLRVQELLGNGAVGTLYAIQASHHYRVSKRDDIRLVPELAGGSLNDLGCYPLRLAQLVFEGNASKAVVAVRETAAGVDEQLHAIVTFPGDRTLLFTCGFDRATSAFCRIMGDNGELRLNQPFHPQHWDRLEVHGAKGRVITETPTPEEPSFTAQIRHIHAVVRELVSPTHLAVDDALGTAMGLQLTREAIAAARP